MTEETKAKETKQEGNNKDGEEKGVKIPKKFASLIKEIEEMPVLDLAEMVKVLEKKFGVSAAAPVVAAPAVEATSGEAETEKKSTYNIEVTDAGARKIAVIKAVREIIDIGLKDAKDLVDKAPTIVKENVPKEEAEEMKKKIEEAGATVELK